MSFKEIIDELGKLTAHLKVLKEASPEVVEALRLQEEYQRLYDLLKERCESTVQLQPYPVPYPMPYVMPLPSSPAYPVWRWACSDTTSAAACGIGQIVSGGLPS